MTTLTMSSPDFTSIDHVVVAVADLDAAARTYSRLLGRAPSWWGTHPGWGTANVLFRLDNTYLELVAPAADRAMGADLRRRIEERGEGPLGFALATGDAAACSLALRGRGLDAGDPLDGSGRDEISGRERHWRNVFLPTDATRGIFVFAIEHQSPPESLPPAAPLGPAAAAIHGLDHLVIRTDRPDTAIEFYRDTLGLRLALDRTFADWGVRLLFFRAGGMTVEIAAPSDPPSCPAEEDSFWGLSWRVADVDAARERLARDSFDVSEVRAGRKAGTRVCTVRAPTHGVATLLIEPASQPAGGGTV